MSNQAAKHSESQKKLLCWMSFLMRSNSVSFLYWMFFLCWMMLIIVFCNLENVSGSGSTDNNHLKLNMTYSTHRKLLAAGVCTFKDIDIKQSRNFKSGRPQNTVQIVNKCPSQCAASDIHLHCGRLAFAGILNPETFKRLSYDDCLVNGGKPLRTGESVSFTYSNSFMPLTVLTVKFSC